MKYINIIELLSKIFKFIFCNDKSTKLFVNGLTQIPFIFIFIGIGND